MPNNQKGLPAGRQGFAHILLLILLLAGIALGVYLVQQKTNLLPKAFFSSPPVKESTTSFELSPTFQQLPDPVPLLEKSAAQANVVQPVKIKLSYEVGDTIPVVLLARSDIEAANLFVAKLKFDKELLDLVSIKLPEIPPDSMAPIAKLSFVTNWVEQTSDQNEGTISLVGGVPAPGYKTTVSDPQGLMTLLLFKAKKEGSATISFTDESQILRNSDNQNILIGKMDTVVKITSVDIPPPTPLPPCPPGKYWDGTKCADLPLPTSPPSSPPPGQKGDGNTDGKINLTDMSVILTDFNKEQGFREPIDMNDDKKINTFDFSLHRKLLIDLKVIKGQ